MHSHSTVINVHCIDGGFSFPRAPAGAIYTRRREESVRRERIEEGSVQREGWEGKQGKRKGGVWLVLRVQRARTQIRACMCEERCCAKVLGYGLTVACVCCEGRIYTGSAVGGVPYRVMRLVGTYPDAYIRV